MNMRIHEEPELVDNDNIAGKVTKERYKGEIPCVCNSKAHKATKLK